MRKSLKAETTKDLQHQIPDTPWDCHICRSVGVVLGVNVDIYAIRGVSMSVWEFINLESPDRCWKVTALRILGPSTAGVGPSIARACAPEAKKNLPNEFGPPMLSVQRKPQSNPRVETSFINCTAVDTG